ncbi:MAG: 50S ribosomal protein L1, partial [Desulfurococcus sp.]
MPVYTRESLVNAIEKALALGKGRRFKQSVEMIVVLRDIDVKGQAGKIREFITLPKGRGKELSVCV